MSDTLRQNLFQLPTTPEGFSVLLPPAELRKLDFSALEFSTARRAIIEYIKTYFPNEFNDFVANNGVIMLVELCAYLTALLSLRADVLANEGFLPTAKTEEAVTNHLALIGQKIKQATPAVVDIECSVVTSVESDISITPSTLPPFEVRGADGTNITYELYAAPGDMVSNIVIPAGKRGVIAHATEGLTKNTTVISNGQASQNFDIYDVDVLDDPIRIYVTIGNTITEWTRSIYIENAGPNDKYFEVRFLGNKFTIIFGNNTYGAIPEVGSSIKIMYRTGGGARGRIGAGVIDTERPVTPTYPYTAPVQVRFRNISASNGGTDKETLDQARRRAPREFSVHDAAVTDRDYAHLASSFSHPVFGAVSKAVAAVRTGLNANLVEVYVLAAGPNGQLQQPNEGLKRALTTYLDDINVITDSVRVRPGYSKGVDLKMTVVMNRNYDAPVVRAKVDDTITKFFDISQWDMGQPLYISALYEMIEQIDGVLYLDLFNPGNNILSVNSMIVSRYGPTTFTPGTAGDADTVSREDGKWSDDGFNVGSIIKVELSGINDRMYEIIGFSTDGFSMYVQPYGINSGLSEAITVTASVTTVELGGIAKNEIVVPGTREISYYYEPRS